MSSIWNYVYGNSKDILCNVYQMLPPVRPPQNSVATPIQTPAMDIGMLTSKLGSSPWIKVAAISGAVAVMMGAYGAHGLKLSAEKRAIFETANKYHFYHSVSLLAVPIMKRPNLVGLSFLGGILIFSGTCYINAITGDNRVVHFTPIGGFMFILGWLSMLF